MLTEAQYLLLQQYAAKKVFYMPYGKQPAPFRRLMVRGYIRPVVPEKRSRKYSKLYEVTLEGYQAAKKPHPRTTLVTY